MPATVSLPQEIREKIACVRRRVRLRQTLRGLSILILTFASLYAAVFFLDAWLQVDQEILGWVLAGWLGMGAVASVVLVLAPLGRPLDSTALASLIERTYPELGERLLSAVNTGPEHGSAAFQHLLREEMARLSVGLDVRRILTLRRHTVLAGLACLALVLVILPSAVWGDYARFARRFWTAWAASTAYSLDVQPGPGFVARGKPYSITARLISLDADIPLPRSILLILQNVEGSTTRIPLNRHEGLHQFTFEAVNRSLTFHVEAGRITRGPFTISAIEPVELAAGGLHTEVAPPIYVPISVHPVRKVESRNDIAALQYSRIRWHLRFTRPVVQGKVFLQQSAENKEAVAASNPPVMQWAADRKSATVEWLASAAGKFTGHIEVEAEHAVSTRVDLPSCSVWSDAPPFFLEAVGNLTSAGDAAASWIVAPDPVGSSFAPAQGITPPEHARQAAPEDKLPVKIVAEDSVGLDRVEIEYRINQGPVQREVLWPAAGELRLSKEGIFSLLGRVKEGDLFLYRFKVIDNRQVMKGAILREGNRCVPEQNLEAQFAYEPAVVDGKARWIPLKIQRSANPLLEQEIFGERDEVKERLARIRKKIEAERFQLEKMRVELHRQPIFTQEQAVRISGLRKSTQDIHGELTGLIFHLGRNPILQGLGTLLQGLAEGEISRCDGFLARSQDRALANEERDQHLLKADFELQQALKRLDELEQFNDRLAQDRLDQKHLELLAEKQTELEHKVAELEGKDPKAPEVKKALDQLRQQQDLLAKELEKLGERSKLFKAALLKARAEQMHKLAQQAMDLAHAQRELAMAAEATAQKELIALLADLARKQKDLADRAVQHLDDVQKTKPAVSLPLPFEDAAQAALALQHARVIEALNLQETSAEKLDAAARDLAKSVLWGRDPHVAVQRLAKVQERIYRDLEKLAQAFGRLPEKELRDGLLKLALAEKELQEALLKLDISINNPRGQAERKTLAAYVEDIAKLMPRDPYTAFTKMEQAPEHFQRLAQALPELKPTPDLKDKVTAEEKRILDQAIQTDKLAKEQVELREAVLKILQDREQHPAGDNPAAKLLEWQKQVAQKAADLAGEISKQWGAKTPPSQSAEGAAKEAGKTTDHALIGDFAKAAAAATTTAEQLQGLAKELQDDADPKNATVKDEAVPRAQDLAGQQEKLAQEWKKLADSIQAQRAQQLARQKDLVDKAKEMAQDFQALAQKGGPESAQAAMAAEKAADAMGKGQSKEGKGQPGQAQEMSEKATTELEKSADFAFQAAKAMDDKAKEAPVGMDKTGQSLLEGQKQMNQAKTSLAQGKAPAAQQAMNQAAQALQKAASQAAQQIASFSPSRDSPGSGKVSANTGPSGHDPAAFTQEMLQKYGGKSWGELPGELRTRLVQDLRARYGDDHARIIQRYFEQIADVPSGKK